MRVITAEKTETKRPLTARQLVVKQIAESLVGKDNWEEHLQDALDEIEEMVLDVVETKHGKIVGVNEEFV